MRLGATPRKKYEQVVSSVNGTLPLTTLCQCLFGVVEALGLRFWKKQSDQSVNYM